MSLHKSNKEIDPLQSWMTLVPGSELRQNLLVTLYSFCEVCAHSELSASAAEIRATSPLVF